MLSSMLTRPIAPAAYLASAALLGLAAYATRAEPLACAVLLFLSAGAALLGLMARGRARHEGLHDPSVSTLVFPPESRFPQSVLPDR
jgi:hypothetical protein